MEHLCETELDWSRPLKHEGSNVQRTAWFFLVAGTVLLIVLGWLRSGSAPSSSVPQAAPSLAVEYQAGVARKWLRSSQADLHRVIIEPDRVP
jgi:hypothetical protein